MKLKRLDLGTFEELKVFTANVTCDQWEKATIVEKKARNTLKIFNLRVTTIPLSP